MSDLTVGVCTHNRAGRLPALVAALRRQQCKIPFSILIVDNNSSDTSPQVLRELAAGKGPPLRYVREPVPGIVPARNRALEECLGSTYMVSMDDDEIPMPGMLAAAVDAFEREGADCVGGRVKVHLEPGERPRWLGDELLGFLAEIDYGSEPFWITDHTTPIYTNNIAYRLAIFRKGLRFDQRYNRVGKFGFGGEDVLMFTTLLEQKVKIRYRPDMEVEHHVEKWRFTRKYFLKLHFTQGAKEGRWQTVEYPRTACGIPPFMGFQALRHTVKALRMFSAGDAYALRQGMNATHALGMIAGRFRRWREDGLD
jgi:glycosyltransferase involved in cell wall biosynthesis